MRNQEISFSNNRGETLTAILELPVTGKPVSFALFAHCFTCTENTNTAVNISRQLAAANIATLRFDFSGLGENMENIHENNFSTNIDDLLSAAKFLESQYSGPEILIGHSLGGTAAILASSRISSVKALITLSAPADMDRISNLILEKRGQEEKNLVKVGDTPFIIDKGFMEDLVNYSTKEILSESRSALLI